MTALLPVLRDGVERVDHGTWTALLAPPGGGGCLRLTPAEAAWLDGLDPRCPLDPAAQGVHEELAEALIEGGFLPPATHDFGDDDPRRARYRVTVEGLEVIGGHRLVSAVAAAGGRWAVTRVGLAMLLGVAVLGAAARLTLREPAPGAPVFGPVTFAVLLLVMQFGASAVHELAHALVLHRHGRRVRGFGVGFYWGALSFFVDATEALVLPRRARAVQGAAGPIADLALAGAACLTAWTTDGAWRPLRTTLAALLWLEVLMNLVPVVELDGHWILADLLDRPALRRQSVTAARAMLTGRSTTAAPRWLALYGVASIVGGVVLLAGGLVLWWTVMAELLNGLLHAGLPGVALAALLGLPTLVAYLTLPLQVGAWLAQQGGKRLA